MQLSTGVCVCGGGGYKLVSDRLARCCELCQAGKLLHQPGSCKHPAKLSKPLARVERFGRNTFLNLIKAVGCVGNLAVAHGGKHPLWVG